MDNSEEDAGNATIDSRRLEAREKELRTAAEALATVVSIRDAGLAPPVGDEVSDIESMPSPGVPDANTSTEAILDMIDEFVDGPIAARRILCSTSKTEPSFESATSSSKQGTDSTGLVDVKTNCDEIHKSDQPAASVALLEQHTQCIPNSSANGDSTTKTSLQVTFPEGETFKNSLPNVCASSILPAETTTLSELPSSSANLTVACTVSSENNVRTVKSVSSSDLSEQIISDSVESSSNDSSVSLNKLEVSTHSPLKRRLVRPAPSDRPPDCTVSSTVDSHTVNVDTSELKSGECVTKDVSSSSDAMPVNVKPEEIRHISEVSLCQAETSVSPPKKIKLVRPKPPLNNPSELNIESISSPDNERCQSTSSEKLSLPSSKSNIPGCSSTDLSDHSLINECKDITISADKQPINDAQKVSELEIVPSSLSTQTEQLLDHSVTSVEKPPTCNPNPIEINTPLNIQPSVSNSESTIPESQEKNVTLCPSETVIYTKSSEEAEQLNAANIQDTSDPEVEKKVPPLKLCVQRSSSSTDAESPSENEIYKRVPPLKLTVTAKELPKINEGTDEDERKVPPIILCKSYDSPIRGLVDDEKSIDTEKKVPPLRINTQTSEVLPKSMTNIPQAERKVPPLRISTTTGDLTTMIATDVDHDKKVPPIKISAQPETIVQIDTLKLNTQSPESSLNDTSKSKTICDKHEDIEKKVPPIKLVLAPSSTFETTSDCKSVNQESQSTTASDTQISNTDSKQVPKLTIKIGSQKSEEMKSPVPKLTIKPIKHPSEDETRVDSPVPSITKLNIKPIPKPAEKIYDAHRKSSSSEISESEYSENDEGTSTSDQASASEQAPLKEVPKVTIKLGKICNQIEPTVPKLTIKGIQNCENDIQDSSSNLKLVVTQTDEELSDKVPKLTIKNIAKTDQPLSPKLTIKPIKPPPEISPADSLATTEKENAHVPKITIKPVLKNAPDSPIKTKRSTETVNSDSIPPVTKLNIKPVIKPQDLTETEVMNVKVPVISKINIKPVLRPNTEDEEESDVETIPQISKINIKPLKAPEEVSSMQDDSFDVNSSCSSEKSIPTVTKLNIKPIIKPDDDDKVDSENQSSETGNSSDDNADVPVVTKLNIKPIIKPSAVESTNFKEETLPVVSKLNIKPIIEPTQTAPLSPRILTKLNIKPIVNPNEVEQNTQSNDNEQSVKNPRLLVKINKRIISESNEKCNNIEHKVDHDLSNNVDIIPDPCKNTTVNCVQSSATQNSVKHDTDNPISNIENHDESKCETKTDVTISAVNEDNSQKQNSVQSSDECVESVKEINKFVNSKKLASIAEALSKHENTKANVQNCKLLKQLLEQDSTCDKYSEDNKRFDSKEIKPDLQISVTIEEDTNSGDGSKSPSIVMGENKILLDKGINTNQNIAAKTKDISKDVTKPLEINTERVASPCSGQDSPRIILKINKTDHGSSAKIITEETLETSKNVLQEDVSEKVNETPPLKKTSSTRRKQSLEATPNETLGKRLRSSKVVHNAEQSPVSKRNLNKRQSTETVASQNKQTDMTVLEAKRLRLGQILSNKSLTVTKVSPTSPPNKSIKQDVKNINHTLLNNENCSKNGNSQLHNIFSNLQAKQIQMPLNDINTTKKSPIFTEARKDDPLVSIANSEEVSHTKNSLKDTVIMMNDFSEIRDFSSVSEERPQDPLEVENKITPEASKNIPEKVMETPTPRKRGRPRKLPVSEDAKTVGLPTPALEERPQRSLRLSRERPAILAKPRGRGRGRGAKRATTPPAVTEPIVEKANKFFNQTPEELDPTSSRVKLPRMTEALDKMPSVCSTPLSSRRHSDSMDRLSPGSPDLKSMMDSLPKTNDSLMRSPEGVVEKVRARRGPGSRGGKVRTPKGRGRGRGGGKGAMYMRETMGIYGRVCGPATTTVELFEEETQMMEDSATPSKPSHLLDEDSQSSVMSSTNDSSKPRKSKFADLFDSNKVWTASDVKEYTWPPPESADGESQVMMIQEQVAMFLSVKSFKRRYPELKRRTIVGEEKEYVLSKGLVTEALCDLGITAVEASEVLDIMLSDYPHKYEEYRTYQRDKQIADQAAEENEPKPEVRDRIEMKIEKLPEKQEPKVDPEKTRQDMAAAAIASASEFNSRMNALRRPAVVDLQSLVIHRRRPPVVNPQIKVQPPGGFYPHALLPGQYQHGYKVYTSEQLRYFPLNTVLAAPPAAASPAPSSGSDDDSSGASDDDAPPKRKKLTKTKRTSDDTKKEDDPEEKVDLCRVCNLRVEANRKYTHERFLVCSSCDAKLHPSCIELNADTIRKCREYAWQCVECKCCATCSKKQDDDKMLFCDLCDRGFHIYCVGLADVPTGRWHCVECAVCKSCGAREPSGPPAANPGPSGSTDLQGFSGTPSTPGTSGVAEWHHQTKRGPGGHKVYSHSLCTPCARAYRIGRYCPLCDRSFVGPKGTMQLIICKLCDRQHHKDCVKQTVCNINVLDYTCGECRRSGITSRSAAVRNAPRTIATLFMAKRRFNKYAHRQYMQSRMKKETDADPIDFEDECSEDITEVSDPLEVTAPDSESMPMDYGD